MKALRAAVGEAGMVDPERFSICGVVPAAAVAPATDEEALALVQAALADHLCCVVLGGRSRVETGGPPARYDFALSTERLTGISHYSPEDLTASFRAGTPLSDVHTMLREHNQWLPWDAEMAGPLTFGGAIATNTSGAAQDGFGSPRDRVLQLAAVTGYGKRISAGAPVVKNVAGYDLHRLFCGSWGTLGLILSAAVRVEPLSTFRTLTIPLTDWSQVEDLAQNADRVSGILVSLTVTAAYPPTATYVLTGSDGVLDWAQQSLPPPFPKGEGRVGVPSAAVVRFVTRPSEALTLAQKLDARFPTAHVTARPVSGVVWFTSDDPKEAGAAVAIGDDRKAHWRVEHGDVDRWWPATADPLQARIKEAFDPAGIFAPGRFVGGL